MRPLDAYARTLRAAALQALEDGDRAAAVPLLKMAIAAGSDPVLIYALGNAQFLQGDPEAAAVALHAYVRIDPGRAEAFNDLSAALFAQERDAEALGFLRRALDLRPDLAEAQETDAIWLLRYGRFREGWQKYEARMRVKANAHLRRGFTVPQWQGEPLAGRVVLLHTEQGLGDALQFARYAPLVAARGGRVVLEAYAEVLPLLQSQPGDLMLISRGQPLPPFDLHCPLLSLPLAFRTDLDSIPATVPYLTVPEDRLALWRRRLGPRRDLRVGLAWSGNPMHKDDRRRSIPFAMLRPLVESAGCSFHVLQSHVRAEDRAAMAGLGRLRDHSGGLRDMADTGALVSLMDVVVSVDTSVAHLAGALGWPTWLLLPRVADWRWLLARDDSPWYPSMELFRQPSRGDWDSVLTDVAGRLREMA